MPKKIRTHNIGDCVEVSTWVHNDNSGFFVPGKQIGLVIEAELVEMDDGNPAFEGDDGQEWMYRVVLSDDRITEVWDYEVKHVNSNLTKYNNISPQTRGTNGKTQHKRS